MSATFRGSKSRDPEDYYKTPRWAVNALLDHLARGGHIKRHARVIDPGAGDGAITEAIAANGLVGVTWAIEKNAERAETLKGKKLRSVVVEQADYLSWKLPPGEDKFDLSIGNPPFSLAMEFVQKSLSLAKSTAMLLRLPWLSSQGRANFLRQNTPSVLVLPKRPEFVAVVKCVRFVRTKKSDGAQLSLPPGCNYEEFFAIEDPRPVACPVCGSKVKTTTSDAVDYAWFYWRGDGAVPRVSILDAPEDV